MIKELKKVRKRIMQIPREIAYRMEGAASSNMLKRWGVCKENHCGWSRMCRGREVENL